MRVANTGVAVSRFPLFWISWIVVVIGILAVAYTQGTWPFGR